MKYAIRLMLLMSLFISALYAQGTTTAGLYGIATDMKGQPMPGVNVVALHVPSGTKYGTTTRDDGNFTIPNLRVGGPYTVSASGVGFKQEKKENIWLALSQNLRISFSLVEETVEMSGVTVSAERNAVMSATHTGSAANVSRTEIDRLPSISRNFQDYYKLSPYFNGSGSNAVGRNNKYNNIQIDGANFTDLFGLGSTGTPAGQSSVTVTPISLDAIEEFQIVISPFDVRQSNFTGAGINAITRSGTNEIKGSVFYNARNENFAGVSPDAFEKKLATFSEKTYGFRIGGPIIENKLFVFANAELARRDAPFERHFNQAADGSNAYKASADTLAKISSYLKNNFGYETGSWSTIPQLDNSDKIFVRFDYNIDESNKLTARWNYLNALDDNSPSRFRNSNSVYSENSRYKLINKTNSVGLQFTSLFGNIASNEFSAGYNHQLDNPTYYGTAFPTVQITTQGDALAVGAEEFRHQNKLVQDVIELTDNFSWYVATDHTVTFGASANLINFENLFISDNFGYYEYPSAAAFLAGGAPTAYSYRYSATNDPLQEANWGYRQFGVYVQDEWTVSPSLKVTGGIRFDLPTYPDKPNYNARFDSTFSAHGYDLSTDKLPATYIAISPRIGFNYAVDEERNTQIRGGIGIFYGRFPAVWVSNQYSNTGVDFYTVTTAPSSFIGNAYGQPKSASSLPTAEVDVTDPNFKAPSIIRYNLAVDQQLPYDLVASVEGIFSSNINDVYYQNINLAGLKENGGLTPGGKLVGENREVWSNITNATGAYNTTGRFVDTKFTAVYLVKNTDQGYNANIVAQVQRKNIHDGLYANLGYTWGLAKDVGGTNSTTASSGWRFNPSQGDPNNPVLAYADGDRRHRIFGTVSYRYDWDWNGLATTVGAYYNGLSGRAFSYLVNGDVNGDGNTGSNSNDLMYIPKSASDIVLVTSAGAAAPQSDYDALMAFINSDSYLKDNKGKISERNAARSPWSHQVDLRITQEIPTIMGQKVELTFDILNFTNLLNKKWGWTNLVANQSTLSLLTFKNVATTGPNAGRPQYTLGSTTDPSIPNDGLSRWSAQFGLRYTF